jgi:hypothetical protein
MSAAERIFATMNEEYRERERMQIMNEEQNIKDFQVDAEVETVQADFYRKPYAEVHDIQAEEY